MRSVNPDQFSSRSYMQPHSMPGFHHFPFPRTLRRLLCTATPNILQLTTARLIQCITSCCVKAWSVPSMWSRWIWLCARVSQRLPTLLVVLDCPCPLRILQWHSGLLRLLLCRWLRPMPYSQTEGHLLNPVFLPGRLTITETHCSNHLWLATR